jgi:hypothetical protein
LGSLGTCPKQRHFHADAKGNVDDSKVLAALQKAKINGMPKANIDRVLNQACRPLWSSPASLYLLPDCTHLCTCAQKSADEKSEVCFVEAIGPGGTYLLIECLTDSRIRTQTELRKIMSKNGYAADPISSHGPSDKISPSLIPLPVHIQGDARHCQVRFQQERYSTTSD